MEKAKSINVALLRGYINKVFDFIEVEVGQSEFKLPYDYYWSVSDDELSGAEQPTDLQCGSLGDDVEFIQNASKEEARAFPLMLQHVAPILYAMATAIPSYKVDRDEQ